MPSIGIAEEAFCHGACVASQEKLQEKRDIEERLFTAQTRSKSLEQRCQEHPLFLMCPEKGAEFMKKIQEVADFGHSHSKIRLECVLFSQSMS